MKPEHLPCIYRGEQRGEKVCTVCRGFKKQVPFYYCSKYHWCTLERVKRDHAGNNCSACLARREGTEQEQMDCVHLGEEIQLGLHVCLFRLHNCTPDESHPDEFSCLTCPDRNTSKLLRIVNQCPYRGEKVTENPCQLCGDRTKKIAVHKCEKYGKNTSIEPYAVGQKELACKTCEFAIDQLS